MASPRALRGVAQPRVRTVGELLAEMAEGKLSVEFDRIGAPEWPEHRKRLLLDSVLRGWPVGPVYVLVDAERARTVVDGGQRLAALREFVAGELDLDGRVAPRDEVLVEVDGKTYNELPSGLRAAINDYPLVVIEFHGPTSGELRPALLRLNGADQLSATQRDVMEAGALAEQVRELTAKAVDWGLTRDRIGFSNTGLAYEDALTRVMLAVEHRDLRSADSRSPVARARIKDGGEVSPEVYEDVSTALRCLVTLPVVDEPAVRFGKATMISWLLLLLRARRSFGSGVEHYVGYLMEWFEPQRRRLAAGIDTETKAPVRGKLANLPAGKLLSVFNERAAVEAMTGESVAVRDAILWMFLVGIGGAPTQDTLPVPQIVDLNHRLSSASDLDGALADAIRAGEWGRWE